MPSAFGMPNVTTTPRPDYTARDKAARAYDRASDTNFDAAKQKAIVDMIGVGTQLASTTQAGIVKQAATMANVGAAPTQADFNNLLTALKNAGLMA